LKSKSKKSEPCTKAEHYANLKWLKAKGYYLDARQFAALKAYEKDPELNPDEPQGRRPYAE